MLRKIIVLTIFTIRIFKSYLSNLPTLLSIMNAAITAFGQRFQGRWSRVKVIAGVGDLDRVSLLNLLLLRENFVTLLHNRLIHAIDVVFEN